MAVTEKDLAEFNRFAERKLSNGEADTFEQLVREWNESRELTGLIDDVQEGEADVAAGRVKPLEQAFSDISQKLGWNE